MSLSTGSDSLSLEKFLLLNATRASLQDSAVKEYISQILQSKVLDGMSEQTANEALLLAATSFRQGFAVGRRTCIVTYNPGES